MPVQRAIRVLASVVLGLAVTTAPAAGQRTYRADVFTGGWQWIENTDHASISSNGQIVAFMSDDAGNQNIFVHDRSTGITDCVNVNLSGVGSGYFNDGASITADGRFVAFSSDSEDLVVDDTNGWSDIFVRDRSAGVTERVSIASSGVQANARSAFDWIGNPAISADGRCVAFGSYADNLVPGLVDRAFDVFVHDRTTGLTECVSVNSAGGKGNYDSGSDAGPSLSADGRFVAFESFADNLVAGDRNVHSDVFVHDRVTGATERVSIRSDGGEGNGDCFNPSISGDGRFVAFASDASTLVRDDTNGQRDVFLHDRATRTTERVSVNSSGAEANGYSDLAKAVSISSDGELVVFASNATNLVASKTGYGDEIYVRNRLTGRTEIASVSSSGEPAAWQSWSATISAGGGFIAFTSNSGNLVRGDTNGANDIFVHEYCGLPASWSNYGAGFPGTHGVPAFTARANPVLGTSLALDLGNSSGRYAVAALFVGTQRASIPSSWGGDLLVDPRTMTIIGLGPSGTTLQGDIPSDHASCGATVDLQALESDPGAAKGVSFTAGLELVLGN